MDQPGNDSFGMDVKVKNEPLTPQPWSGEVLDFNNRQKQRGSERTFVVDSVFRAKSGKNNSLTKGVLKVSTQIYGFIESRNLLNEYNRKNLTGQLSKKCE